MANGISTLGQALDQISRLKTQQRSMDLLATQLNTGKKTQRFSGLGSDAIVSQRARTDVKALDAYMMNITIASRRITSMETTVSQMKKQATELVSAMQLAMQQGEYPNFASIQQQAQNAYDYMLDLLNMEDDGRYLFAGADSSVKPISDTGQIETFLGEFVPDETDINNPPIVASGIIGQWGDGTLSTTEFIEAFHAMTNTTLGYSDSLAEGTAGKVYSHVNQSTEIDYTVLANEPGLRDIMMVFSVLKSLPPIEHTPGGLNDPDAINAEEDTPPFPSARKQENFFAVIDDLVATLNNAVKNIDQQSHKLALAQSRINSIKSSHTQEINTLKTIVSDVEDVDTTEVAAKITQLQVQIEASYQVTALTSQLTLVNFL